MPSTSSDLNLTYVGHATVLLEMNGARVLTDPLLRDRTLHLRRAGAPVQANWHEHINVVLISHLHWDHFDEPSLKLLHKNTPIVVPKGAGQYVEKLRFAHVHELAEGGSANIAGLSISATHAVHPSVKRGPRAKPIPSLGYMLDGERQVYFAGDTDIFDEMAELSDHLDVALLPIWGWGPRLGKGHMNPLSAAQSLALLKPKTAVPIHWGTLHPLGWGHNRAPFLHAPATIFKDRAAELAPHVKVRVVGVGERVRL